MMTRTIRSNWAAAVLLTATVAWGEPAASPVTIKVDGAVETPLTLSAADVAAMPQTTMKVKDHDGKDATYTGVLVRDLLLKAGVPLGQHRLKGPLLACGVAVTSADGYKTVFGLAEFDDEYAERDILLATHRDGQLLDAKEGTFRLVVPQEGRQGRWSRVVTGINVFSTK